MGGNKPAQRTKNNARPASSGRSAELLSGGAALFPTLREEAPALHLDGPLLLCVKKLHKKDPITKIKALQELCTLVKEPSLSPEELEEVLQYWARVYPALSLDEDHKLREATQRAHGALVRAAGRGTARVLRAVCGAWLAGEGDGYEPAGREARRALRDVLPGERRADMVAHCRVELVQYGVTRVRVRPECAGAREAAAGARVVTLLCRELPTYWREWLAGKDALGPLLRADTAPWGGRPASWDDAAWQAWLDAAAALLVAVPPPPEDSLWTTAAELALRECHADLLAAGLLARPELPVWTRDGRLTTCAVRLPGHPTLWPLLPRDLRDESLYRRCTAALLDGMISRGASREEVGELATRLCDVLYTAGDEGELPAGAALRLLVECCGRSAREGGRAGSELGERLPGLLRRRDVGPHFWTDLANQMAHTRDPEPAARAAAWLVELAAPKDRVRPRCVRFRDEERPRDELDDTHAALLEDATALLCRRWLREDGPTAAAHLLVCRFSSSSWVIKLAQDASPAVLCEELCARMSGPPELRAPLAAIVFLLLPHLTEQQQINIFRNMEQLSEEAAGLCAVLCARGELKDTAGGRDFMRGEAVTGAVRAAVRGVLRRAGVRGHEDEPVLAAASQEEELVMVGGSREVVRLLGEGLAGCEREAGRKVAGLLWELLWKYPDADTALALLRLDLKLHGTDMVRGVSPELLREVAARAASLLHAHMYDHSDPDQIASWGTAASVGGVLVQRAGRGMLDTLLPSAWQTDSARVALLALRHEAVCGRLHCPLAGPEMATLPSLLAPPEVVLLDRHTRRCLFRAAVLLLAPPEPCDPHLLQALHDSAALEALSTCQDLWPHYNAMREACGQLREMCKVAIEREDGDRAALLTALEERAAREGGFWAVVRAGLGAWAARGETTVRDVVSGDGLFHRLQVEGRCGDEQNARDVARLLMYRTLYVAHGADERILPPDFPLVMVTVSRDEQLQLALDAHQRALASWPADLTDRRVWPVITSRVALLDMLRLELRPDAPASLLDFASVSLCDALDTVSAAAPHWTVPAVAALAGAAFRLRRALTDFMETGADGTRAAEWRDVFEPEVSRRMLSLATQLLLEAAPAELRLSCAAALPGTSWAHLPVAARASLPLSVLTVDCARGVVPPAPPAAHHLAAALLDVLADSLLVYDATQLAEWAGHEPEGDNGESGDVEEDEVERAPPPPLFLHHLYPHYDELLRHADRVLTTVKVAEESWCEETETLEGRCAVRGWLVLQRVMLCVATRATGDLAQRYATELARAPRPDLLARNLLRLLPLELLQHPAPAPHRLDALADLFWARDGPADTDLPVAHLACDTLRRSLCGPGGAGLRGWWGAAGTREANCLERTVRACVSPRLVRAQLTEVRRRAVGWRDVEVQVAESTREVRAKMPVDDRSVELWLQLSERHPLGGARADREWVRVYVDVRGGAPWAAVRLWADSARRRLERTGPCYICYSRLHADTGRRPARPCPACRNKYHKECINKWFATNHNYTCPLCRSPMPH